MSDSEENDLNLEDRFKKEEESLKLERDLLEFIFHFKEYIKEKVLFIGDTLESYHLQDFIEFII